MIWNNSLEEHSTQLTVNTGKDKIQPTCATLNLHVTTTRDVTSFVKKKKLKNNLLTPSTAELKHAHSSHTAHTVSGCNRISAIGVPYLLQWACIILRYHCAIDVQCDKNGKFPVQMRPLLCFFILGSLFSFLSWEKFYSLVPSNRVITTQFHILLLTIAKRV